MLSTSTPISLNISVYNPTEDLIDFTSYNEFNSELLERQDQYAVAVTRCQVPTDEIETFVVDDTSKYEITFRTPDYVLSNTSKSFTHHLPDSRDIVSGTIEYGKVFYYSNNSVIERISRVMYRCYADAVRSWNQTFTADFTSNANAVAMAAFHGNLLGERSFTPSSGTGFVGILGHIEVQIYEIALTGTNWNIANPTTGVFTLNEHIPFQVVLVAPDDTECVILSGRAGDTFINTHPPSHGVAATNKILALSEEGLLSSNTTFNGTNTGKLITMRLPNESFLKLHGKANNQPWKIQLRTKKAAYGGMRCKVLFSSCKDSIPTTPPIIGINESSGYGEITFTCHQDWAKSGVTFAMSPFMKSILNFGSHNMKYNPTFQDWELIIPEFVTSTGNPLITLIQSNSTRRLLMTLKRIIISSTRISSETEFGTSLQAQNILTDFSIDTDVNALGELTFSDTSGVFPWRRYKLNSSQPLKNYDVRVFVEYSSGETRLVKIGSGQTGIVRLTFFPL